MKRNRKLMWTSILAAIISVCSFTFILLSGNSSANISVSDNAHSQRSPLLLGHTNSTTEPVENAAKVSPFIDIRWDQDDPEVLVIDYPGWVKLEAIDDIAIDQIISMCRKVDKLHWRDVFTHNLIDVMIHNGHTFLDVTTIRAITLKTNKEIVIPDVDLNKQNYENSLMSEANDQRVADELAERRQAVK